ncbi:MAG: hypothetical protein ACTSXU_17225 [Promethearchaeota archaeon]
MGSLNGYYHSYSIMIDKPMNLSLDLSRKKHVSRLNDKKGIRVYKKNV